MTVISITLPQKLLKKFDDYIKAKGYYSRSEAFRDAIRTLLAESEIAKMQRGNVAAVIMVASDYARKDVDLRVTELRHEFDDVVVENIHRHVNEKYCLEFFVAEGNYQRILNLIRRVRGMRSIQQIRAIFMPL